MRDGDGHPEIAFGALGPLTVTVDGTSVTLGAAKSLLKNRDPEPVQGVTRTD